jgi:tetratricopeptide (TPR) repeat protein/TolB-like protein
MERLKEFIYEIHRRSLWQVLGIYLVGGWLLLQVVDTLVGALNLPDWAPRLALFMLIIGLPIVLATAFVQEGGPTHGRDQARSDSQGSGDRDGRADSADASVRSGFPEVAVARRVFSWRNVLAGAVVAFAVWGVVAAILSLGGRRAASDSAQVTEGPGDPNVVAVFPFRVSGADEGVAFLREGMVDALAQTLTGEGGPRAVDPRVVISAWHRSVSSPGEDLSDEEAMRLSRSLGAGLVLLGGVIGTGDNLILNASLVETATGENRGRASVEGPVDSLTSLVNGLTAKLLVQLPMGQVGPRSNLGSTSLPVIRLYLQGQAAHRQGRYETAANLFERALSIDSTFAPAAVGLRMSANWFSSSAQRQRQLAEPIAWEGRERLSPSDRALLLALVGETYPVPPSPAQWLDGLNEAVQAAPDRPEVWYELGDWYYHDGSLLGVHDRLARARAAFGRAVALDSTFSAALEHLVDVLATEGDTTALKAISRHYMRLHPDADVAGYYRWRVAMALADTVALRELRQRVEELSNPSLWRIIGYAQTLGIGMEDARRAVGEIRSRPASQAELETNIQVLEPYAINTGQPGLHSAILAEAGLQGGIAAGSAVLLPGADYWDADSTAAAQVAEQLARYGLETAAAGTSPIGLTDACLLGLWYLNRDDLSAVRRTLTVIGEMANGTDPVVRVLSGDCRDALESLLLSRDGTIGLPVAIARLEEALRAMPLTEWGTYVYGAPLLLELSRLYELEGDYDGALATIRRRRHGWSSEPMFLSTFLREEGRLAARAGDRESAIRAYRHYLTLRESPEPRLIGEVEEVRVALAELEATEESSVTGLDARDAGADTQ